MKRILGVIIITLTFIAVNLPVRAEENRVEVNKNDTMFNIYVMASGSGYTLEAAKSAAISNIMPQLIEKTKDLPGSSEAYMGVNGIGEGEGVSQIAGKTLITSHWTLKDGIYHYSLEFIVDNSRKLK